MKHVRKQYNRFSFRLTLLGVQVDAGHSYKDEWEAAFYCDLTKHYLRDVFRIAMQPSGNVEDFNRLAHNQSIDLTSPYEVHKALPAFVREFIDQHRDELNNVAEAAPGRSAWASLRCSPAFSSSPDVREWVLACERAEVDVEDFAALNGKFFLTLIAGLSSRSTDILKPLALAIKMHAGVENPKLVERLRLLNELQTNLQATEAYMKFLTQSFADEQQKVVDDMAKLEASRPSLA